jgi:hypothetical protein
MGMFDHVVVLDEKLSCPHGHGVGSFQTKSFSDASMDTYLVDGAQVYRVASGWFESADDLGGERWILQGHEAVCQRRHALRCWCAAITRAPGATSSMSDSSGSSSARRSVRADCGRLNGRPVRATTS